MGAEQIARAVGDQEWLDGLATPMQEAIRSLFESAGRGGREAKKFLHGSALGHPLHPAKWAATPADSSPPPRNGDGVRPARTSAATWCASAGAASSMHAVAICEETAAIAGVKHGWIEVILRKH